MSRFFEALKEADRLRSKAPVSHGGLEPRPLNAQATNLLDEALAGTRMAPPVLTPEPEPERKAPSAFPEQDLADLDTLRLSDSTAPRIPIAFDPTARLITNAADPVVSEHYRKLRTRILQLQAAKAFRSLLVVSPSPREGKTVTVLNLALSFAMLESFKVLVVDGDLRKGNIGRLLGLENRPGLTNLVEGSARAEDTIFKCDDIPIHFLLHGNSGTPPAELLNSPRLGKHLRRISEQFDLVLVDSAPVNPITDTQLLAGSCDAILLVARAFSTTRKAMEQTVQELSQRRIIGTVLNSGPRSLGDRRYNGYY
jgi:capsular exopolysaccharide synthesis family protein